ncbi:MAG TPA: hypothetical protein VJR89_07590 [Polyangiales bacterium]|nr:hypothetical protein [Polyangiales bacterium]
MPLPAPVRQLAILIGLLGVGVASLTVAQRIGSPWPLEWMEGAILHHALRILHGQAIYTAPSAEFIPFVYPPLSYLPIAACIALFGPELWAGRLPSVLAFAGSLFCIFRMLRRETGFAALGCWGAGIFALGFGYTGAFLDLVRVDAVFVLLVLLGIERLSAGAVTAGLCCLAASCLAKQHGSFFLLASALWLMREAGRQYLLRLAAAVIALALVVGWLDVSSRGAFASYVFWVPAGHGLEPPLLVSYVLVDVLVYLPVLALFSGLGLARGSVPSCFGFWLAAGLVASALGRAHPGGDDNVRLPGFALLVLCAGLAFPQLWAAARNGSRRALYAAGLAGQALLLLQLPAAHSPRPEQAEAFRALRSALSRCAGGELSRAVALDHTLFTGRPFLHTFALSDLELAVPKDQGAAALATRALVRALASADAPPSVAVSATFPALQAALDEHYEPCAELPALRMPTGYALGRTHVYRRRAAQVAGAGLLWR